jgi:hypothetical protein
MNEQATLINQLNAELPVELAYNISKEDIRAKLAIHINHLITTDFEKLIFYLYRIDVDEAKMRIVLQEQKGEMAGTLIADMIIDRLMQKIKSRQQFSQRDNDIEDENKW